MMTSCGFFGADAIIFDLEDAVSPDEKDAARILVKYAVTNVERCRSEIIVRVNAADTPLFAQDLEAVSYTHLMCIRDRSCPAIRSACSTATGWPRA